MGLGQKQSVLACQLGSKLNMNTYQLGNKKSMKTKNMAMNPTPPKEKMSDLERNNATRPFPTA
jgi:hypothetical protein